MAEILDINTLFGPLPAASTDLTIESLIELMQQHQVTAACTLSTLGLLLDPMTGNAITRATCADNPELMPAATMNPLMYFGNNEPMQQLVANGFRLIRFFPTAQGWPIQFAPFLMMLRVLQELPLPVMIHVETLGEITALAEPLGQYPAPVILAGVASHTLAEGVTALRQFSHWHIETSRLLSPGAIKLVTDAVGPTRLLFGSSAPSQPLDSALKTLSQAGLEPDVLTQVLATNARRVLHL